MPWYVLHIKPHSEIKAATALANLGFSVYCPVVTEYRQWSDRVKKVEVPLIRSYIFVNLEEKDRPLVFQVPGILRYLYWLGKPAIVPETEIKTMQLWLQNDIQNATVEQLQPGDRFSIPKGPFIGQESIIHEVSPNRLQVLLVALGIKITMKRRAA